MLTNQTENENLFELISADGKFDNYVIGKRRLIIGRSDVCDICIPSPQITSIHAVLEINGPGKFTIYDMNSTNGTYVNGSRVIAGKLTINDKVAFSEHVFSVKKYEEKDIPPALDMLSPTLPPKIFAKNSLPEKMPNLAQDEEQIIPRVAYPLGADPKAEFSAYIFEDIETLYPIFKYKIDKYAVEVIILHKDRIYSVDYLPQKSGEYRLVGFGSGDKVLELPYLGLEEEVPFIQVSRKNVTICPLSGYEYQELGGEVEESRSNPISLVEDEIHRFRNGDIQIYVRGTEAPPSVSSAPLMRRDPEFKKYIFLMLLLVISFLTLTSLFKVDKEIEKEKAPERIATILYKKKLFASKNKAVAKTKKEDPKIKQKVKKIIPKIKPPKKNLKTSAKKNKDDKAKIKNPKAGKNDAKVGKTKKATPNKGPKNIVKDRVSPKKAKSKGKTRRKSKGSRRASRVAKSKGHVDTYKSVNFKSTISSLMAKGGASKSAQSAVTSSSGDGYSSVSLGESGATLKTAKVSTNVGSISGASTGKLDVSKGVEGLVSGKKKIYMAGIPSKTVVWGGMNPDDIRRILEEHIEQFTYCYQRRLDKRTDGAFSGIIKLNFMIGASGHVTKAGVGSKSSIPVPVKRCVVNVLRGIVFPEPPGGGVVEVDQPMNFQAKIK